MKDIKRIVRIEPTSEASQRTKNRIRERGPFFQVDRHHLDGNSWLMREVKSILPHADEWIGWLPVDEFRVIEKVNG